MKKIFIVARREYTKTIRKPSFWATTLLMPILIVGLSILSGVSGSQTEEKIKQQIASAKEILVIDNSGYINKTTLTGPFKLATNLDTSINDVKDNKADALIVFPQDLDKSKTIQVYAKDQGLFSAQGYNDTATNLLKNSILSEIKDQQKLQAF